MLLRYRRHLGARLIIAGLREMAYLHGSKVAIAGACLSWARRLKACSISARVRVMIFIKLDTRQAGISDE